MAEELKMDPYEEFTKRLCESLSPGMGETAVGLLKSARSICPYVVKRPINALAAGIVYYAAMTLSMPVSISGIARAAGAKENSARKAYRDIRRAFETGWEKQ
jgi:transcription initiation factor TFIIIB Brf1 subunit/transcription initiation factor TFIIB